MEDMDAIVLRFSDAAPQHPAHPVHRMWDRRVGSVLAGIAVVITWGRRSGAGGVESRSILDVEV